MDLAAQKIFVFVNHRSDKEVAQNTIDEIHFQNGRAIGVNGGIV